MLTCEMVWHNFKLLSICNNVICYVHNFDLMSSLVYAIIKILLVIFQK